MIYECVCVGIITHTGGKMTLTYRVHFFSINVFACKQWTQNSRMLIQMCPEA